MKPLNSLVEMPPRMSTGLGELDLVLGGGIVHGSATLIGGEPGIGKSTLLIQTVAALARACRRVSYISGEESDGQVRLRAQRLGLGDAPGELAASSSVRDILTTMSDLKPELLIIDSIQTVHSDLIEGAPGTVSQVRACSHELISFARRAVPLSSSSGTSRRTELLPAPAYWNTWSIPSYRSRKIGVTNSECSERSTTALAELTKSASLPWVIVVWPRYRTQSTV